MRAVREWKSGGINVMPISAAVENLRHHAADGGARADPHLLGRLVRGEAIPTRLAVFRLWTGGAVAESA